MEVIVAREAGFCFGVRRAMEMVEKALRRFPTPIYSLGPLIHNPQVVEALRERGLVPVERIEEAQGVVVFRSHGVERPVREKAKEMGIKVIDATCPFVRRVQRYAQSLSQRGYLVLIVGDRGHAEVNGILSYLEGEGIVVEGPEEVALPEGVGKVGVVAQTTQSFETFQRVVFKALKKASELRVYKTLCDATQRRQEEALKVIPQVECMVVVGGYNSANTRRLASLCRKVLPRTYHVETEEDLDPAWFRDVQRVGVTGGASTPDWMIKKVAEALRKLVF